MPDREPAALTVQGRIGSSELGTTLMHEHVLFDGGPEAFWPPDAASDRSVAEAPISLEDLGWIRSHPHNHRDNYRLLDIAEMIDEVRRFVTAGGGTIVEVSPAGLGRDLRGLARISREAGVHIIAGTGYYTAPYHPDSLGAPTDRELADGITREIVEGADGTGIRPGVIGEIGCSWPLTDVEAKVVRAAAIAQRQTGAPLIIHPGPDPDAAFEIVASIQAAGGDPERTMISHIDGRIFDEARMSRLAGLGCYLAFDLFGRESSHEHPSGGRFPNDGGRVASIMRLIDMGHLDRIVISHDICFKTRLLRYGGHGYAHIVTSVLPLMSDMGMGAAQISAIVKDNPQRLLAF